MMIFKGGAIYNYH